VIRQLAHVCLGTRNLDAALKFYVDVLGFEVIHEFHNAAGELYGAFIHCGSRTFLELFNDQKTPQGGGLYRHLAFEVDDLEATVAVLGKLGCPIEAPRRGGSDHVLLAMARDPDGNTIEFQQYDSVSIQKRFLDAAMSNTSRRNR
jgi:glyoxylase I family protein